MLNLLILRENPTMLNNQNCLNNAGVNSNYAYEEQDIQLILNLRVEEIIGKTKQNIHVLAAVDNILPNQLETVLSEFIQQEQKNRPPYQVSSTTQTSSTSLNTPIRFPAIFSLCNGLLNSSIRVLFRKTLILSLLNSTLALCHSPALVFDFNFDPSIKCQLGSS